MATRRTAPAPAAGPKDALRCSEPDAQLFQPYDECLCDTSEGDTSASQASLDSFLFDLPDEEYGVPAAPPARAATPPLTHLHQHLTHLRERELQQKELFAPVHTISLHRQAVIVDFLTELQDAYTLRTSTLFLAVSLLRRVLMRLELPLDELQLAAVTCLVIASKFEEGSGPSYREMAFACANAYSMQNFIHSEMLILKVLEYQVATPHAFQFVEVYANMLNPSTDVQQHIMFLMELSLTDPELGAVPSSVLAASIVQLGYRLGRQPLVAAANLPPVFGHQADTVASVAHALERLVVHVTSNPDLCRRLLSRHSSSIWLLQSALLL